MPSFGQVPPEPPRETSLDGCAPKFSAQIESVLDDLAEQGFDPVVYESLRTQERQRWLHGFGRDYDDGRGIVTNVEDAQVGWHFFGLATDIISKSRGWDWPEFFDALAKSYISHRLTAGASWQMRDMPHGQWGKCRNSPSEISRQLYIHGGVRAVWEAVEAI